MAFELVLDRPPLTSYLDDLREGRPFVLSRWGDGEWSSLLRLRAEHQRNCDGHRFFKQLGNELAAVLISNPAYPLALQPFSLQVHPVPILAFCQQHLPDRRWTDAEVLQHISVGGLMPELLGLLRQRPLVLVGPAHLRGLTEIGLSHTRLVVVPDRDSYLELPRVQAEAEQLLGSLREPAVCCISMGMPAGLLIDRLYPHFGQQHWLLDCGSVWDPYVGQYSREGNQVLHSPEMVDQALAGVVQWQPVPLTGDVVRMA